MHGSPADRDSTFTPDIDDEIHEPISTTNSSKAQTHSRNVTYSSTVSNRKSRASAGNARPTMRCFCDLYVGSRGHQDAKNLAQLGVWLGDIADENATINGLTHHQVKQEYFQQKLKGKDCSKAEPIVYEECTEEELVVECTSCKAQGIPRGKLTVQMAPFGHRYIDCYKFVSRLSGFLAVPHKLL